MKLKKLALKNIRSYKDGEIIFPEGSVMLTGDIGSGKTSVLLAVEYSLFGLQPGQKGSSLLRNGANSGSVTLELEIGGRKIIIKRRLKRNHKTVTNEYASIIMEDEKIESSLTEIKTKILECMGYPKELIKKNNLLYRYTVYTPQEQMKQIILEDAETRINILRHILSIDKYKRIKENLTIFLNQLKEESKVLQGEIKTLDEERVKLELRKAELKTFEEELIVRKNALEASTSKIDILESEYSQLEERIKEREYLEKEVEKTKIIVTYKFENREMMEAEIQEIERNILEVGRPFNEKEHNYVLSSLNEKNMILEDLNIRYTNLLSEITSLEEQQKENIKKRERIFKIDICPTCLQDIPEVHKHNVLNETENFLSKIKQRIELLEKEIVMATKEIDRVKSEKRILEEQRSLGEASRTKLEYLEKIKKRRRQIESNLENLEKDISLLNKHINTFKEKILGFSKYSHIVKIKKLEIKMAVDQERKAEISLAEIKKEIELRKKEIVEREESIRSKERSKQSLTNRLELYDWLSFNFLELIEFTERNVLMKLRQEFSRAFSKWFHMLVPQGSLSVRLDESFSPIILQNDIEMEYSYLSGGERTAVALAYRLALNQTINSMLSKIKTKDIVILDEPTDGFSETQLDRMQEVLQELKVSQLIIVSHERKMEDFVDNIIRIKKSGDISMLENSPFQLKQESALLFEKQIQAYHKT